MSPAAPRKTRVRPGLILGLGRLGGEVIEAVSERLDEIYGQQRLGCLSYFHLPLDSEPRLSEGDTLTLRFRHQSHDDVAHWWYPGWAQRPGSRPIRAHGRLLLVDNYQTLREASRNAESRCRDPIGVNPPGFEVDLGQPTCIYLVSNLQLVESGLLLDLAFLLRQTLGPHRISLEGLFVPHMSEGTGYEERRQRANLYAFFKELNHYSSASAPLVVDWFPGRSFALSPPVLDTCLFLEPGPAICSELAEQIVKDYTSGPFAAQRRSLRVNLRQLAGRKGESQRESLIQSFACRFGGARLGAIGLGHRRLYQACTTRLAASVVQRWTGGEVDEAAVLRVVNHTRPIPAKEELIQALIDPLGKGDLESSRTQSLARKLAESRRSILADLRAAQYLPEYLVERVQALTASIEDRAGSYFQIVRANRHGVLARLQEAFSNILRQALADDHLSLEECHALFGRVREQVTRLQHGFAREMEEESNRYRLASSEVQRRFSEVVKENVRISWLRSREYRVGRAAEAYLDSVLETGCGSLQSLLRQRALAEAVELCRGMLEHLDGAPRARGQHDGLLQRIRLAQTYWQELQSTLLARYERLSVRSDRHLLEDLGSEGGLLERIYTLYVGDRGWFDRLGAEILTGLGRTPLQLPEDRVAGEGARWEAAILHRCGRVFDPISQDFHVLRQFFTEQDEQRQEAQVRHLLDLGGAKSGIPRSQAFLIVGLPSVSEGRSLSETAELRDFWSRFEEMVRRSSSQDVHFLELPESDEILFCYEVGGLPLNMLLHLEQSRADYELFFSAGEPLHTDSRREDLDELTISSEPEREALAEAFRAFVLGRLLGIVEVHRGEFFWNLRRGLYLRRFPLGSHTRALARLCRDERRRRQLLQAVETQLEHFHASGDAAVVVRLAAKLAGAKIEAFGEQWGQVFDLRELPLARRLEIDLLTREEERLRTLPCLRDLSEAEVGLLLAQVGEQASAGRIAGGQR
ncbi:MAG: tubulin-like doman-containing protein [Vulcanimicrobiota bacterium]